MGKSLRVHMRHVTRHITSQKPQTGDFDTIALFLAVTECDADNLYLFQCAVTYHLAHVSCRRWL